MPHMTHDEQMFKNCNAQMLLDGYRYALDEQHRLREQIMDNRDEHGTPNDGPGRCLAMACMRLGCDEVVRKFHDEMVRRMEAKIEVEP